MTVLNGYKCIINSSLQVARFDFNYEMNAEHKLMFSIWWVKFVYSVNKVHWCLTVEHKHTLGLFLSRKILTKCATHMTTK